MIVHRLTKEQQQKRLQAQNVREKKKRMKNSARSKRLSGISVYMTNPLQILSRWDKYMIGIL
ncbi:Transposase [Bacillus thuringiensis serovar pondicheriensis BGSC 4BA1]|nr:Transposase [Bacillus thuringiensis serovar pondicheriensis BGSC 4BA1]